MTRGVDHQPVGERVGDLAEARLDVPAAREEAVDLVGDAGDAEDDPGRPRVRVARLHHEATKSGISASRPSVSAFGSCASGAGTARVAIPGKCTAAPRTLLVRGMEAAGPVRRAHQVRVLGGGAGEAPGAVVRGGSRGAAAAGSICVPSPHSL